MVGGVVFVIFVIWFIGAVASTRLYYRRRHGVLMTPQGRGGMSAMLISFAWPIMWFVESYRNPQLCTHHEHLRKRAELQQMAAEHAQLLAQEQMRRQSPRA